MATEVDKLNGSEARKSENVSIPRNPPLGIRDSSVVEEEFESRLSTMNEIMEALDDRAVNLIGLHGLGGVGKITLAKQVAKKAQEEKILNF